MSASVSMPLMNALTLRPVIPTDRADEPRLFGVLEQQADVAQSLMLAHRRTRPCSPPSGADR
jgi:hypothetical protein